MGDTRSWSAGSAGRTALRGEVSVEPRTDEPDRRFAAGAVLATATPPARRRTAPADRPRSPCGRARWHQDRLLVALRGAADRTAAEAVRGPGAAVADGRTPGESPEDPEEFYDHQLVGLRGGHHRRDASSASVAGVVHGAAQDLLAVRTTDGREVLVPFVTALVPSVDVAARPDRRRRPPGAALAPRRRGAEPCASTSSRSSPTTSRPLDLSLAGKAREQRAARRTRARPARPGPTTGTAPSTTRRTAAAPAW